jgi:iron complex outermembrane receptor protein
MGIPTRVTWLVALAASALAGPAFALDADLSDLSLEELASVEITSVSRRGEPLGEAAAAVYLISADDIRRSGAASLPEVLRLAPNLQVQRVNAGDYAISARGFNSFETSNKLLVLIDGRSVYSTLHSGVFWDVRTMMLEDIERIEVVSGPGGTLFGANAVNGVINIITRSAADTIGTLGSIGIGSEDKTLALRHGGPLGENGAWRAYVSAFDRDDSLRADGSDATDATSGVLAGARTDWASGAQTLTVQGEIFTNRMRINEDFSGTRTRANGGHLLGRWTHAFERAGQLEVQAYFDRSDIVEPGTLERSDTYDIHVQQTFAWRGRHQMVVGGGYRSVASQLLAAPGAPFLNPPELTLSLANVFAQDQVALTDTLTLTVGVKFEDNSFTGQELLPNVRLAWSRPDGSLYWGAVSRASRTPSRIERGLTLPGFLEGGDFQSETLTAYELGYRANPTPNTAVSVSAFYNEYDSLRTLGFTPVTVVPFMFANDAEGSTQGVEAWGSWDVNPRWRLSAGVSTLEKDFEVKAGQIDIAALAAIGDDPGYQAQLRSRLDVTDRVELDLRLRAVDELDTSGTDGYVEADARLGWRLKDDVELAVTGQNLIEDQRFETGDPARRRAFGRSVYANLRWSF